MELPDLREIFGDLENLFRDCRARKLKGWSKRIFRCVANLCPRSVGGRTVYPQGRWLEHEREYLVDQSWRVKPDANDKTLPCYKGLVLAMECELGRKSPEGKWHDFVKLADVRADLRVFLGGVVTGEKGQKEMRDFVKAVSGFLKGHRHSGPEDQYLIALYFAGEKPDDKLHGWLVHGDGRTEALGG